MKNMKMMGTAIALAGVLMVGSIGSFAATPAPRGGNMIDDLLKDGVITQAQIDAYRDQKQTERTAAVKTALDGLVTKGTIKQEQADLIYKQTTEHRAAMQKVMDEAFKLPVEERQAYIEKNAPAKSHVILDLVSKGTLTVDQAVAIQEALKQGKGGGFGMKAPGQGRGQGMGRMNR